MAEPSSSGCCSSHFSKKPYPTLHTQCSQVSLNKKLSTEVGEQAAQFPNTRLKEELQV